MIYRLLIDFVAIFHREICGNY